MAVATEPLAGRHMVALYSSQVSQGTGVTPATSPGIVTFNVTPDSDMRPVWTIGNAAVQFLKPGIAVTQWAVNVLGVQTKAVLALGARTSGTLPWITWGFGQDYDSGANDGRQIIDCKVGQMDIALDAGGLLTANLSGVGGLATTITIAAMAHLSETPMMSYEAVLTVGGSAYIARSFRVSVNHNISVDARIHGAAPSTFKRGWSYQTEGQEEITGEITRFDWSGVGMHADTISDGAMVLTLTDIVGGLSPTTITLTFAGVKRGAETFSGEVDGIATFSTPFQAKTMVIS